MKKLDFSFYLRENVVQISKELLGKVLYTKLEEEVTAGVIVETEAYAGVIDKASHAYGGRLTNRTKTMYRNGGVAYVYLCYGIHKLFNVVTNVEGVPHAVLVRAVEPFKGEGLMLERRGMQQLQPKITSGPGALTQALGIGLEHNGLSLLEDEVWIADEDIYYPVEQIISSTRVGVGYAKEDALLPYRFRVKSSKYTSPAK